MSKDAIEINNQYKTIVKSEDGKLYAHTTFYDDKALAQNQKIRMSGMMERAKLDLHEGEDIRCVISCPDTFQWSLFKREHTETYKLITSQDETDRMKGVRQLEILHPEWVIMTRI